MFCNVVYARLAQACMAAENPGEARQNLDHELSAPARGWAAVEADLWGRVMAAPDLDDEEG
jgi:hypothetical protein